MKIISSQRYTNSEIVSEKMAELEGSKSVTLPVVEVGFDDLFVLIDGHHRLAAARELGIEIKFEVVVDSERRSGEDLLEQTWIDSNWYYIAMDGRFFRWTQKRLQHSLTARKSKGG